MGHTVYYCEILYRILFY